MDLQKQSPKQRANYHYMADAMRRLEWDLHNHIEATGRVPAEWHDIARDRGPQPKVKTTMRVDTDVMRFFKSMGAGHLTRMNEVLRTYMHARLAGVIRGAETVDYYKKREEYHDGERPLWGDTQRMFGELPEASEEERRAEGIARMREETKRKGIDM